VSKSIVFLGDAHLSDRRIKTRVDDTVRTCLEKFEWVLNYAVSIGADIIHTGDFVPCVLFNSVFRYDIKVMLRNAAKRGVCFYTISGNHDVSGNDFGDLCYRELGQLVMDGYVHFLGPWGDYVDDYPLDGLGGVIRGYSAYSQLETGVSSGFVRGLVCHHWIGDAFEDSLVVYPDDMKGFFPNLKFIVAGHDHAFHSPYVSRDGVLVVRMGSMMRTDSGASSDRIPCVAVWHSVDDFGSGSWEYVGIGCARPYSEVFYTERKAIDKGSVRALEAFVKQMGQSVDVVLDINSVIKSQFDRLDESDKSFIREDLVANGFLV
jgi:hypothetical protein